MVSIYAIAEIDTIDKFDKKYKLKKKLRLMSTSTTLKDQGFSEIEIQELSYMTSSTESYFNKESSLPNFYIVAMWEAERLAIEGTTEKIRVFSKKVADRFNKYYTSMQK